MFNDKEEIPIGLQKKISLRVDENIINQKMVIPYPLPELRGLLISNKINQEPIYLYMAEEQYLILKYSLKIKDYHLINDKNNINKLIKDIGNYFDIFYKTYPLSSRINISYQENIKNIKPYYSFILVPDEKFKAKYKFNEYIKQNNKIREHILSINNKLKRNYSIKLLSTLLSLRQSSKKLPTLINKITYEQTNDLLNSPNQRLLEIKKHKNSYKQILRELFSSRLNDFRKDIVEYCLDNTKYFREDCFENFVCFIEFFVLLFCGIKTKYYIDEFSFFNMDFYTDEKNMMNFAESFHYQVQFRIKDIPFIAPNGKRKLWKNQTAEEKKEFIRRKYDKLMELNKEKIPNINQEMMEYYPTHCDFSRTISPGFRRYDQNDDYHICEICKYIPNSEVCKKLGCSSCFRHIDKERLICLNLSHIMNFNKIKELCKVEKEEEKIFMNMIMMPNYDGINNRINNKELISNYLVPFETSEILKLNKTFRDIYGEIVGFYFVWISHFIKWLFYMALIGIGMSLITLFFKDNINKSFSLILNLAFITCIVLWGNYYYISWDGQESFYNHIWGMNDYILIQNSVYEYEEKIKLNVEIIMGVKIPIEKTWVYVLINVFLFIFSIFLHIIMIISNILIISTKSYVFHTKIKILDKFLNATWVYTVPVFCYFLRELFSYADEKWDKWIISHVKQVPKDLKRQIRLIMKIIFEFFNYYFNLYYIAFIKNYYGTCLDDDCHSELGNQLTIIIICDLIIMILSLLIPVFYNFNKRNEIENKIRDITYEENCSNKYKYYTRNSFIYTNIEGYYIKAILYFGYILQFGASAPMTFMLILITTIFNRIILGISLKNIYYAQIFGESIGIIKLKKWIRVISFIGIISNLCCIFYTNNYFYWLSNGKKLIYIALTENIVLIIIKIFDYDSLPKWFYYKDKIDFTYLRKFGIRAKKM